MKPDQLIKRRGKLGLIHVKGNNTSVKNWIAERIDKPIKIERAEGKLKNFIVEPFLPHGDDEEAYVCIYSTRDCDVILFHKQGKIFRNDYRRSFRRCVGKSRVQRAERLQRSRVICWNGESDHLDT